MPKVIYITLAMVSFILNAFHVYSAEYLPADIIRDLSNSTDAFSDDDRDDMSSAEQFSNSERYVSHESLPFEDCGKLVLFIQIYKIYYINNGQTKLALGSEYDVLRVKVSSCNLAPCTMPIGDKVRVDIQYEENNTRTRDFGKVNLSNNISSMKMYLF